MLTLQIKEKEIENLTPEEEFVRGTVGAKCQINFDEFWQSYNKYIVFKRVGYEPINFMVDTLENEIEIPYTILAESGEFKIGVFGTTETETLPTLYSKDIKILYGTDTHGTTPPTYIPSEIDQLRLSKQDKLTAGNGIKIENNVISSSGTIDYELLENKPQINGVELLGNKSLTDLGIDIPTKTSELENDSGFIDDTAFENYYTKTEVDEKTVVDQTYNKNSQNAQSGKAVADAIGSELYKKYELIEKIVIGYSITTAEPSDWETNYTDYFTNTGTLKEPVYTAVSGETAPTWKSATYYSFNGSSLLNEYSRNKEPDGNKYSFKKFFIKSHIKWSNSLSVSGHFRFECSNNPTSIFNYSLGTGNYLNVILELENGVFKCFIIVYDDSSGAYKAEFSYFNKTNDNVLSNIYSSMKYTPNSTIEIYGVRE